MYATTKYTIAVYVVYALERARSLNHSRQRGIKADIEKSRNANVAAFKQSYQNNY
jgi:hypothetical protein